MNSGRVIAGEHEIGRKGAHKRSNSRRCSMMRPRGNSTAFGFGRWIDSAERGCRRPSRFAAADLLWCIVSFLASRIWRPTTNWSATSCSRFFIPGEGRGQKISNRTRAGMARAKAKGIRIGRPKLDVELRQKIAQRAAKGETPYAIAKALGVDRHTAASTRARSAKRRVV